METIFGALFTNLWLMSITTYTVGNPNELRDYCAEDIFHAECPMGEVIMVEEAQYGRMQLGTCLKLDIGFMNCYSNVTPILDALCSGRQSCSIAMHEFWDLTERWDLTNSCPREIYSYLQARYICVQVVMPGPYCCQLSPEKVRVQVDSGILASSVTSSTGCGDLSCPWVLKTVAGKQINISLIDFQYAGGSITGKEIHSTACDVYALIKEEQLTTTTTLCGGRNRKSHVYTSTSNVVQISFVRSEILDKKYFLVEYEAFGCPNPLPPDHGLVERNGTIAKIICLEYHESDDSSWEIICIEGVWNGEVGNCSAPSAVVSEVRKLQTRRLFFGPEVVIALIIVVALLISVSILVIGILTVRRQSTTANTRYLYATRSSHPGAKYSNYSAKGGTPMKALGWSGPHPSNYENAHTLPKQWRQTMPPNRDSFVGDNIEHIYETPASASGSVLYHTLDPDVVKMQREKRYKNRELINEPPSLTLNRGSISRPVTNHNQPRNAPAAYLT